MIKVNRCVITGNAASSMCHWWNLGRQITYALNFLQPALNNVTKLGNSVEAGQDAHGSHGSEKSG